MPKRQLSATEVFDLRQALHVATLDALMASRRWEPGDLVFQGGTSLHLAHGSPRFSEDLDFLINSALKLDAIGDAVQTRLEGTQWVPGDTRLMVGKAKDGHNPHSFVVSIGGPDVIGSVRVKVELWQTAQAALSPIKAIVAPIKLTRGPASGMQAFVPTASLAEIHADKVFALAARPYLKPRDVFDLQWLSDREGLRECSVDDLRVRLATYPSETPREWIDKAFRRRLDLYNGVDLIHTDLKRWLPSSWPLTKDDASTMVETALRALDHGIDLMEVIAAENSYVNGGPTP